MLEILKMINMKEEEFIIITMVIDMKENLKKGKKKEKGYTILIMAIE